MVLRRSLKQELGLNELRFHLSGSPSYFGFSDAIFQPAKKTKNIISFPKWGHEKSPILGDITAHIILRSGATNISVSFHDAVSSLITVKISPRISLKVTHLATQTARAITARMRRTQAPPKTPARMKIWLSSFQPRLTS